MKEKMKKVLGSMRKKSTHSGVIDEDIRSKYSAVSMDEPSITSAATSMRTSRSKVGSAFVPVTKTTLPKDISISSPEVVSAKVDEEEDFNNTVFKGVIARAKRGRVVENEYEKANCRPTRPDPTRRPSKRGGKMVKSRPTSYFKSDQFC